MFLTEEMRFLTSFWVAMRGTSSALRRPPRPPRRPRSRPRLGLGRRPSSRVLARPDPVGLALLERRCPPRRSRGRSRRSSRAIASPSAFSSSSESSPLVDPPHQVARCSECSRRQQPVEELLDALGLDPVEVAAGAGVDRGDLVGDRQRACAPSGSASRPAARRGPAAAASRGRARSRTARTPRGRGTARGRARSFPATFFIAFVCALPPTRETEMPTLIAGRSPCRRGPPRGRSGRR